MGTPLAILLTSPIPSVHQCLAITSSAISPQMVKVMYICVGHKRVMEFLPLPALKLYAWEDNIGTLFASDKGRIPLVVYGKSVVTPPSLRHSVTLSPDGGTIQYLMILRSPDSSGFFCGNLHGGFLGPCGGGVSLVPPPRQRQ